MKRNQSLKNTGINFVTLRNENGKRFEVVEKIRNLFFLSRESQRDKTRAFSNAL